MAQFGSDAFAGTTGNLLSTYSASWTQHAAGSVTTAQIASGRVRGTAAGAAMYLHSGTPATADYSVSADVYEVSDPSTYQAGVVGRVDTTAVTGYMARHAKTLTPIDAWQLYKFVANTFTQLGANSTDAITTSTAANVELRMVGTAIALRKRGGTTDLIAVTDSAVTAAGKAGIRLGAGGSDTPTDTTLYHIDNFSADDITFVNLFLRNTTANGIGATYYDMLPTAGASADTAITATTLGGTEIQLTKTSGGALVNFVSGRSPVGGFTLTEVRVSIWGREDNALTNAQGRLRLFERTPAGVETEIAGGPFDSGLEFTTTDAEYTWTAYATDTVIEEDNRIVAKLYLRDIGTMVVGDATMTFNAAAGVTGDSFISIFPSVAFKAEGGAVTMGGLLLVGVGA